MQRSLGGMNKVGGVACITINSATPSTDANQFPIQGIQCSNDLAILNTRYDCVEATLATTSGAQVGYNEQRYIFRSQTGVISYFSYQLNLDLLKHSLLSINKDLFCNENIVLSITFAPASKFTWIGTTNFSNGAGHGASTIQVKVTKSKIIGGLREQVMGEGFSILCVYVYSQKVYSGSASTSSSIFQRFNRGHGRSILRTYWSLLNGSEKKNTTLDRSNAISAKVTSYRSTINNMNIQEW